MFNRLMHLKGLGCTRLSTLIIEDDSVPGDSEMEESIPVYLREATKFDKMKFTVQPLSGTTSVALTRSSWK